MSELISHLSVSDTAGLRAGDSENAEALRDLVDAGLGQPSAIAEAEWKWKYPDASTFFWATALSQTA